MLSIALYGLRACRIEYTFPIARRFLTYKMIARDLLGCTGRWGFVAVFEYFSGFECFLLPSRIHAILRAETTGAG